MLVADCEGLAFSPHCTGGISRVYGTELIGQVYKTRGSAAHTRVRK